MHVLAQKRATQKSAGFEIVCLEIVGSKIAEPKSRGRSRLLIDSLIWEIKAYFPRTS